MYNVKKTRWGAHDIIPFSGQKKMFWSHSEWEVTALSRKNLAGDNALFCSWYLLGVKNNSHHIKKTGS